MLEAVGLTKRYGEHLALASLGLPEDRARRGVLPLGANGAGRTTTLNLAGHGAVHRPPSASHAPRRLVMALAPL